MVCNYKRGGVCLCVRVCVCVTTTILELINESRGVPSCNSFERVSRATTELHSTDETLITKKNSNADITPADVQ